MERGSSGLQATENGGEVVQLRNSRTPRGGCGVAVVAGVDCPKGADHFARSVVFFHRSQKYIPKKFSPNRALNIGICRHMMHEHRPVVRTQFHGTGSSGGKQDATRPM